MGALFCSDALVQLKQKTYDNVEAAVLGNMTGSPKESWPVHELEEGIARFQAVQELVSQSSKMLRKVDPAVESLVEKNVLAPQKHGVVADSRLKQEALDRLVQSPFALARIEQAKHILAKSNYWFSSSYNRKSEELEKKAADLKLPEL